MKHIISAWLLAAAVSASAAPIYRCGQTYSQTPCPGGRVVEATDPRTAAQRAEAMRQIAKDKALADQMEQNRRTREADPPHAAGFDKPAPPASAASKPAKSPKPSKRTKKHVRHKAAASSPEGGAAEAHQPQAGK